MQEGDSYLSGIGFRVEGFGFRVEGLGVRVEGLGVRVEGLGWFRGSRDAVTTFHHGPRPTL